MNIIEEVRNLPKLSRQEIIDLPKKEYIRRIKLKRLKKELEKID